MDGGVLKAGEGRSIWVTGDLYTIKASGEDTGGAFALIEAVVPPGGGPPPHVHRREDEAFYILDGELLFHADGRDIAAGAGSWVTLARGSLHHFKNVSDRPARMLIVVTPPGWSGTSWRWAGRRATGMASRWPHARGHRETPGGRPGVRHRDPGAAGMTRAGPPRARRRPESGRTCSPFAVAEPPTTATAPRRRTSPGSRPSPPGSPDRPAGSPSARP